MHVPQLAVVGCGYWGSKHLRVISESTEANLALAVDSHLESRERVRATYPQVPVSPDFEDVLRADVDGVILATPISTHYQLAEAALEAGKHVLIEKPLATTAAEARELIEIAERKGLVLMVGHTFEYHPAVEYLRHLVASGELGQVYYIDTARLNLGLFQRDADVLWDLAPHDLSIVFYVLGREAHSISARGSSHIVPGKADIAFASLAFDGGISAHLHVSWLDPCKVRRVTVVGSRAMAVFNDVGSTEKIKVYDKRFIYEPEGDRYADYLTGYHHGNVVMPPISGAEPLRLEVEDFAKAIATGSIPRADGWSGLRVVEALDAAASSMAHHGRHEALGSRSVEPGALNGNGHASYLPSDYIGATG